ncbi:MAG TPA: carbonic anhydrase [Pyrinomonadaceae bacterium]|nr:carbonic anhydrase [Pyrinomonadaceae bacterium]
MTATRHKFATAITCIDGRVQQPVADWMKLYTNVHYVDLITEPGPDKVLSSESTFVVDEIVRKVKFSVQHHASAVVAICGHYDCAANDATKEEHIEQIIESVRVLLSYQINARILGLWLNEWSSVELVWDTQEKQSAGSFL